MLVPAATLVGAVVWEYCCCCGLITLMHLSGPAKGLDVQVHNLISLGGWNDVISMLLVGSLMVITTLTAFTEIDYIKKRSASLLID
jgi:hypothetical protein